MEIKGRITKVLDLQTGEGKNGTWKKQEYVIEKEGQYPKNVCFSVWGDKVESFGLAEGDQVLLSIDIESREFNNKWYTNVQCWKAQKGGGEMMPEEDFNQDHSQSAAPAPTEEPSFNGDSKEDDVLPF